VWPNETKYYGVAGPACVSLSKRCIHGCAADFPPALFFLKFIARRIGFSRSATHAHGRVTPHSLRPFLDYSHSMNNKKLFFKTNKVGFVLVPCFWRR